MIYETKRLLLKPTSEDDARFICKLFNSPAWLKFIGERKVYSPTEAEQYIKTKMTPQFENLGYGNYTIIRKSDNVKMGTCGLSDRKGLPCTDIGFAFLPEYGRKGYAHEAANKLKEVAFNQFKLKELCGITTTDNKLSQKLLLKLGFHYNGTIVLPGETNVLMCFTMTNPSLRSSEN